MFMGHIRRAFHVWIHIKHMPYQVSRIKYSQSRFKKKNKLLHIIRTHPFYIKRQRQQQQQPKSRKCWRYAMNKISLNQSIYFRSYSECQHPIEKVSRHWGEDSRIMRWWKYFCLFSLCEFCDVRNELNCTHHRNSIENFVLTKNSIVKFRLSWNSRWLVHWKYYM